MLVSEKIMDKVIGEIFEEYINNPEYTRTAHKSDAAKTFDKFHDYIKENTSGEIFSVIEDLFGNAIFEHEKQGFIHGFKYACKIINEHKKAS